MKKNFIILIVIAVALTGFLYSRPKVVVKDEAKANRDFAKSDLIRDRLAQMNIQIKDSKEGTSWSIND